MAHQDDNTVGNEDLWNDFQKFVYLRTYARWIPQVGRRERWSETVRRYINFMKNRLSSALSESEYRHVEEAILSLKVMPSMRLLQFAGVACDRCNVCAYNCAYIVPTCFRDLAEIMYISMSGCGVGWSVEASNVQKFPPIRKPFNKGGPIVQNKGGRSTGIYIVPDSREGWCDSLVISLESYANGEEIEFDYSRIRPMGARLNTMGGRASGPEPLKKLHQFIREKVSEVPEDGQLRPIDLHDIICKIGEVVVSGSVRRSAMISLSDLHDENLRDAKTGQFWEDHGYRMMANNSAVYNCKPSIEEFTREWQALRDSGTGERGIFNRSGLYQTLPRRRIEYLHTPEHDEAMGSMGCNPCGEIILQSKSFCNLSEVICRADDTIGSLREKIKIATILGTYQATLVNFQYISPEWREHQIQERLLGVSLTGQADCPAVRDPIVLRELREYAIEINREYALRFGVIPSLAITTVKPSGTVSQMVNSSSGLHRRFAEYYLRRIRISSTDVLLKVARDSGIKCYPETGSSEDNATTYVVEFPVQAPHGSLLAKDETAIEQLEYWKMVKINYTEHNPSVSIYIRDHEWDLVKDWILQNWIYVTGISLIPLTNHVYQLAPYHELTKEEYDQYLSDHSQAKLDFSLLDSYEKDDQTDVRREWACSGISCEL